MLPCQASSQLRWMWRPCLRLYIQHTASLSSIGGMKPDLLKPLSADVSTSPAAPAASLGVASLSHTLYPSCCHSSRPFHSTCSVCDIAQQKADKTEIQASKIQNEEKMQVILAASFEELMDLAQKVDSVFLACVVVQRLCWLYKEGQTSVGEVEALLEDSRLKPVCKVIDENITRLSPKAILSTLQSLYEVTHSDVYIVKSLAMQMMWLMRRLPLSLVIQTLQLHLRHKEGGGLQESMVQQALSMLERRWVELTSPKDIIFLMYVVQEVSSAGQGLVERLEDRALDVVDKASPKELYRIIYLLSRQRHRNTPLIRAIVYHLNKTSVSFLSTVQLTNLLYALCVLNVFDPPVLSKVSAELRHRQADLSPKLVSSIITSFSRLRWKDGDILPMLMDILEGKSPAPPSSASGDVVSDGSALTQNGSVLESLEVSDKVGLLLLIARLNVDTVQSRQLVQRIVKLAEVQHLQASSPWLWLDVVWSLCVLQMADAASVASVLTEDFWGTLPSSDSFQSMVHLAKVNNINSAALYEVEGYSGPFLPRTMATADAELLQRGERKAAEKLVTALTNFAPRESYTLVNTTAPGGYLIDAEFYVDGNGNPKPRSQVSDNSSEYHRVALKVLNFPDLTLPTSDLTGLQVMAARHLRSQGYTVVQVKHTEIPPKSKVVELVNLLKQKVKDALKVNNPNSLADS